MGLSDRGETSGEPTTRIKLSLGADLEPALSDQGLRCYPRLTETTTGDRIRIFRAGPPSAISFDAVLVPSPDHDRRLAETLQKFKGTSEWDRSPDAGDSETTGAPYAGNQLPCRPDGTRKGMVTVAIGPTEMSLASQTAQSLSSVSTSVRNVT